MKYKIIFFFLLVSFIVLVTGYFLLSKTSQKNTLRVLTYSSFAGVYGPGRMIKKQFESFCECKVLWFLAEDSTALLQRFILIPDIDVIIGWDQITLQSIKGQHWEDLSFLKKKFVKTEIQNDLNAGLFFQNPYFLPLDWAPIGFLYKDKNKNIKSLKSLFEIEGRISFPEPRTSTLGLQLYYWIYEIFEGDEKRFSVF